MVNLRETQLSHFLASVPSEPVNPQIALSPVAITWSPEAVVTADQLATAGLLAKPGSGGCCGCSPVSTGIMAL